MKRRVRVQSGASVQTRENGRLEALEARAGVEQPDEAGPAPGEVAGEEERVVLADHAVGRVRAVEPVHADADHRIVDGAELLDRLVRLRQEAGDAVGLAPELLERALELRVASSMFGSASSLGLSRASPGQKSAIFFFMSVLRGDAPRARRTEYRTFACRPASSLTQNRTSSGAPAQARGSRRHPPWPRGARRHSVPDSDAERACAFVIDKVRASAGPLFHQGARRPPLVTQPSSAARPLRRRTTDASRVDRGGARARGMGQRFSRRASHRGAAGQRLLALQAGGARCVSLLPDGAETAPHADASRLRFHDLCHLDKFIDPEHHRGQVGFFACLHRAVRGPRMAGFETHFDAAFPHDWQHVAADMNGSAVFFFAALKMKLKMAVRRAWPRSRGAPRPRGTADDQGERARTATSWRTCSDLLRLHGDIADAARRTSARRDDPDRRAHAAATLRELGRGDVYVARCARFAVGIDQNDRPPRRCARHSKRAAPLK